MQGFKYTINSNKVTITGYIGESTIVTVPQYIEGCVVTSIGNSAFNNTGLTEVEIPSSVTSIGDYAFANCEELTKIVLNDGLKSLGQSFIANTGITELTIPKTVTEAKYALYSTQSLKKVVFSQGIKTIPAYAFDKYPSSSEPNSVEEVIIPDSVISIG